MQKKFWVLCVSRMPGTREVTVKIFSSEDIPGKGEKLYVLGKFNSKKEVELLRSQNGDENIIEAWKRGGYFMTLSQYIKSRSGIR